MPALLRDVHRILVTAGRLEVRLTDAVPRNAGPKLLAWLGERLLVGLEGGFRASRPSRVLLLWLAGAGLRPGVGRCIGVPVGGGDAKRRRRRRRRRERVTFGSEETIVEGRGGAGFESEGEEGEEDGDGDEDVDEDETVCRNLGVQVAKEVWKDNWGAWVEREPERERKRDGGGGGSIKTWWWDDDEILEECAKSGTIVEIIWVVGIKD